MIPVYSWFGVDRFHSTMQIEGKIAQHELHKNESKPRCCERINSYCSTSGRCRVNFVNMYSLNLHKSNICVFRTQKVIAMRFY
jgi:hypothetical protein